MAHLRAMVVVLVVGACLWSAAPLRESDETVPDAAEAPFPDASSTGVPSGVALQPYAGPCTITETTVLSQVDATGVCPAILVQAPDVVIERSRVPRVDATAGQFDASYAVTISDSDVRAGKWIGGALWGYNITAVRVDVTGGQHSFHCNNHCVLEDSWLHDQYSPPGEAAHNNAFLSNGGTDMVLRHNTLYCTPDLNATGGGCTADLSLFGDFDPIRDVTVTDNLFRANDSSASYCAYGGYAPGKAFPVATGVVFTDNTFERGPSGHCGVYGPVTSFQPGEHGNAWSGNVWDDGGEVRP